jgi:hypothetical protein
MVSDSILTPSIGNVTLACRCCLSALKRAVDWQPSIANLA